MQFIKTLFVTLIPLFISIYSQTSKLLITYVCIILFIVSCYIFWILLNNWIFIKKYVEWVKTYAKNKTEK